MIIELPLADIPLDRGTRVRVMHDPAVVQRYAEQFRAGAIFPPVTVFNDEESGMYLADGFLRVLATAELGLTHILAEVVRGTFSDALWHAMKANRINSQPLNDADFSHMARLALLQWPAKLQKEIAEQIGCSPSLVSKVAGDIARANGGGRDIRGKALAQHYKREAVKEMVLAGQKSVDIRKALHAHPQVIGAIRKELGVSQIDYTRKASKDRLTQIRALAGDGYSSRQIAATIGLSDQRCRDLARKAGIDIPADQVVGGTRCLDGNRIVAEIVIAAENLTAGVNLVDYRALDRTQIDEWIRSLLQARADLGMLIKRLKQELSHEAA